MYIMAKAKGKGLPDENVDTGRMVEESKVLMSANASKAALETLIKNQRTVLEDEATTFRKDKLDKKEVVGMIRITDEKATYAKVTDYSALLTDLIAKGIDPATVFNINPTANIEKCSGVEIVEQALPPVRIEMKMTDKACLDVAEWSRLEVLFGSTLTSTLYKKQEVVSEIKDFEALVADLKTKNIDPNTVLEYKVREGMEEILVKCPGVGTAKAIIPLPDFLANLKENAHVIQTDDAWDYMRDYLNVALKPTVVAGTNGKS
jgi:hypothetical protein